MPSEMASKEIRQRIEGRIAEGSGAAARPCRRRARWRRSTGSPGPPSTRRCRSWPGTA
ncbi:hypothetical protein ACFQZC_15775 [Streptacidiphilus monticola]